MKTQKEIDDKRKGGSAFIRRDEVQRNNRDFLGALDRAIEFHRINAKDPYNVGNAVIVALIEVRNAFDSSMKI